jgi:hypothetical protein
MGRRSNIDWEQVERLYIAGQLTIRQIAVESGVSDSQVRAKAKKHGWQRDLSAEIEARTKAKIAAIDVSALIEKSARESAHKSAQVIKDAVEHASDVAAGVELRHRAGLRLDADRADRVEAIFDEHMSSAESVRDVSTLAQALKVLVDAKAKIREQERTIYKLDRDKPVDTGLSRESVEKLRALKARLLDAD